MTQFSPLHSVFDEDNDRWQDRPILHENPFASGLDEEDPRSWTWPGPLSPLCQMHTMNLLTEAQRIADVSLCSVTTSRDMVQNLKLIHRKKLQGF